MQFNCDFKYKKYYISFDYQVLFWRKSLQNFEIPNINESTLLELHISWVPSSFSHGLILYVPYDLAGGNMRSYFCVSNWFDAASSHCCALWHGLWNLYFFTPFLLRGAEVKRCKFTRNKTSRSLSAEKPQNTWYTSEILNNEMCWCVDPPELTHLWS